MNDSSLVFEIIDHTVSQSGNKLNLSELCAIAGVSRSGYYAWKNAEAVRKKREEKDQEDFEQILTAYRMHGYPKGAKGVQMTMLHFETPTIMNLKKIRRLMRKYHLLCPVRGKNPYRQLARELKTDSVAENLLNREFESYGPRMVLLTDITYLPYNGTYAYLSTILDAYTKQVLAYKVSNSLKVDFVLHTIRQLIDDHGISLNAETIVHSDQGCHYTSLSFRALLKSKNLRQSMSRRGNCWDNAPQESFFGHMKDLIGEKLKKCTEFAEVKSLIEGYMDYYNNDRYQWELAKLSPNEFYEFCVTGEYPLNIPNKPFVPVIEKQRNELGAGTESSDSTLGAQRPGSA